MKCNRTNGMEQTERKHWQCACVFLHMLCFAKWRKRIPSEEILCQGKSEYLLLATGLWVILVKFLFFFACELLCKSSLCLNDFIIA